MGNERNLSVVISNMLDIIPMEEQELITNLCNVQDSIDFTAPEAMGVRWRQVADCLNGYFMSAYDERIDWHRKVVACWTGKEPEKNE